jgi:sirohydrochlorin ferrochelatase
MTKGIIILGHGSRRKAVSESFTRMVRRIAHRVGKARVEPAFFSLGRPTLEEKISELIAQGCREIVIFPYFLYNGNHVEKDIPAMLQSLKQKYSEINFHLLHTLENEPLLEEIIYKRIWPYADEQTK